MNGIMSPRCHMRALIALALAGWMAPSMARSQDDVPPPAPPAFPSDEPLAPEITDTPSQKPAVFAKPTTQLIPTSPDEQGPWKVEALPTQWQHSGRMVSKPKSGKTPRPAVARKVTPVKPVPKAAAHDPEVQSLWSEPQQEPMVGELDQGIAPIQQVQASELVAPDSVNGLSEQAAPAPPVEDPPFAGPGGPGAVPEVPTADIPAEMPAEDSQTGQEPPLVGQPLEPVEEPVQFQERPRGRTPAQYEIDRTAANEQPEADYSGQTKNGFGQEDKIHLVGAGESFWTISKKEYGMGRYHAALAEYNKARIPQPDKIKPGMKVVVPPVQVLNQLYGRMIFGAAYDEVMAAPAPAGFFVDAQGQPLYRVGKGDTLGSIAETNLGRSSRWVEIVKLNPQSLKNHDVLKLGTVLRLPNDASEAATK